MAVGALDIKVPRSVLIGAGMLLSLTIVAIATARLGGLPEAPRGEATGVARSLELTFLDDPNGLMTALPVDAGGKEAALTPEGTSFVRGMMRGLQRERMRRGVSPDAPFRVTQWSDGRATLSDPGTGVSVELEAFGADNAAAVTRLIGDVGVTR
jgi:putative photosynthetic complex assembly protein